MRFKAILVTEEILERPVQIFSTSMPEIYSWAGRMLRKYKGTIQVYEMIAQPLFSLVLEGEDLERKPNE